jgi:hypothetical protein
MPSSLTQIQERVGPAPKPEDINASSIVCLYSRGGPGRRGSAPRRQRAWHAAQARHIWCAKPPQAGYARRDNAAPCPSRLQPFAGKSTDSHPLPSGGWRPEFSEQHSQGFTQLEPVAGGVGEQESALSNKASILDSSAASRLFSCRSCSVSFLSCSDSFLSCSVSLLSCFIRCSCCIFRCS